MALLHVDFFSDVLGMCMQMDVILPEKTRGQIGMEGKKTAGKTKTLYLLHGMSDDHTIWQRRTSIERYAAEKGIAVVMPTTHLGWYTDMHIGYDYFTFITEELPAICRNFFPMMSDKREDNFVAGLSMGGYGAMKCGLRANHVFSKCASLSGAVDIASTRQRHNHNWKRITGGKSIKGTENDLFHMLKVNAEAPHKPRLYVSCGTADFLYGQHKKFIPALKKAGWDVTAYEEPDATHEWGFWDQEIRKFIEFCFEE